MRSAAATVFLLAAVAQWLVPLAGIRQHERVIARGTVVRVECVAPDPYDPLRGRYLAVRAAETALPAPAGMPAGRSVPVWATLAAGADGLARIESLSLEPVSGPTVIRLVATDAGQRDGIPTVWLAWPFDRFYLNERLASDADAIVAERFRDGPRPVAEIRLLDGRAVLVDVLVGGVSIGECAKRRAP